jgi:GNAT superfamily N-acetyltransferase
MRIDVLETLDPDATEAAWQIYLKAFEELRTTSVHRQYMHRHEYDEIIADRRVLKYIGYDDGGAVRAIAGTTKYLNAMPLIAPEYFEHRWPTLYAEQRICYWWFVAVDPPARGSGIFELLVQALYQRVVEDRSVVALDFCRRNVEELRLPQHMDALLTRLSDGHFRSERIDEESFWFYDFDIEAPAD